MKRKSIPLIILSSVALLAVLAVLSIINYRSYHPQVIVEGENKYQLGADNLTEDGLSGLEDILAKSQDMPTVATVSYLEASITDKGDMTAFTLTLLTFDENGEYCGTASYTYSQNKLIYTAPAMDNLPLAHEYNANSSLAYLDDQIRGLPLKKQCSIGGLDRYVVRYQPYTVVERGTPIFDGRDGGAFPVLSPEEYNAGKGGVSDGDTNVVFRLYDGVSIVGGQQYLYVCRPADPGTAVGNRESTMECDYYLNNYSLLLTRDYGAHWLDTGLTEEELDETLETYGRSLTIPVQSFFVAPDESLPIACFYGAEPALRLSGDNGASWRDIAFPTSADFGRPITRRVIGFLSQAFGYAALGTEWSMGGGENKMCYFTADGGETWTEKLLPQQGFNHPLLDMAMADENTGAVSLDSGMEVYFPLIYVTSDQGTSWAEVLLSYEELPADVQYLTDIESFTFEDGVYRLTLGQDDSGTIKATFTTEDLSGMWEYTGFERETIHTVG